MIEKRWGRIVNFANMYAMRGGVWFDRRRQTPWLGFREGASNRVRALRHYCEQRLGRSDPARWPGRRGHLRPWRAAPRAAGTHRPAIRGRRRCDASMLGPRRLHLRADDHRQWRRPDLIVAVSGVAPIRPAEPSCTPTQPADARCRQQASWRVRYTNPTRPCFPPSS